MILGGVLALGFELFVPAGLLQIWRRFALGFAVSGVPLVYWLGCVIRHQVSVGGVMGAGLTRRQLSLASCASLAMVACSVGWGELWAVLGWPPPVTTPELEVAAQSPALLWSCALVTVVLAPCTEEVLFRGIIFRRLLRYSRPIPAGIFSSVLFGALHMNVGGGVLFGLVMVLLYACTRSLWVPVVAHVLNNLVALLTLAASAVLGVPADAAVFDSRVLIGALPLGLGWTAWFVRRSLGPLHDFAATIDLRCTRNSR